MKRMTLDETIAALIKLREDHPELAEMEVYCEDPELGVNFGNALVDVGFDDEGTNLLILG